jgi:hypothetical protein
MNAQASAELDAVAHACATAEKERHGMQRTTFHRYAFLPSCIPSCCCCCATALLLTYLIPHHVTNGWWWGVWGGGGGSGGGRGGGLAGSMGNAGRDKGQN